MTKPICFLLSIFWTSLSLNAQTLYVDAVKGREQATGTLADPLASLEKAVALASDFTGNQPVTIKIYPGLYTLTHQLEIRTRKIGADSSRYSLEAAFMPDDPDWNPTKMPVIQSVSADNSVAQFSHSVGVLVAKPNVSIQGLKFVGNANPNVRYYYPITRENETYRGLTVSQCYFIGDKNAAPIQAAIWAHGPATVVDHCIFYNCKNALILLKSVRDFSLTYSIIYGAYEAAVWYGPVDPHFTFHHNIVAGGNFFWLRPENTTPAYVFSQSLITSNAHYMGMFTGKGPLEAKENKHTETGIRKVGNVVLSEVKTEGLPPDYLNPTPHSDGYELKAGVFKRTRP